MKVDWEAGSYSTLALLGKLHEDLGSITFQEILCGFITIVSVAQAAASKLTESQLAGFPLELEMKLKLKVY